jgi:SAM-dependent methyltransferase
MSTGDPKVWNCPVALGKRQNGDGGLGMSYRLSAQQYDSIYEDRKDYFGETERISELVRLHSNANGNALLDVGCGTGLHDQHFSTHYQVEGLDNSPEMLAIARKRLPKITFHEADMADFDLHRTFDVVVSLFSAIGHLLTVGEINSAVACMARHVAPGGVLLIEPWFVSGRWKPRERETIFLVDKGLLRITESKPEGDLALLEMHYFTGWPENPTYFLVQHRLGLHSESDFANAFESAGLELTFDEVGLTGRGLFIGRMPLHG